MGIYAYALEASGHRANGRVCRQELCTHTPHTETLIHSYFFLLFFKLALSLERHVSEHKQELEIYQCGFAGGEFGEFT